MDLEKSDIADVTKLPNPVLDLLITKHWAIKFATDAALTILRVDQVCYIFYKKRELIVIFLLIRMLNCNRLL